MVVKFKKLNENAVSPKFAKDGDAGADLTVASVKWQNESSICYGFGLSVEIPKGFVGLIFPRSSIYKTGAILSNAVGVIDSGYRGEISAVFHVGIGHESVPLYKVGERACQMIIVQIPQVSYCETQELSESERGTGGYGSSGR